VPNFFVRLNNQPPRRDFTLEVIAEYTPETKKLIVHKMRIINEENQVYVLRRKD